MKFFLISFLSIFPALLLGQNSDLWKKQAFVITPEFFVGKTMEANDNFPQTGLQFQTAFGVGRNHISNPQEWAQRLKGSKTGLTLIYTHFGNLDSLGIALSLMPIIEFNIFRSKSLKLQTGIGASYFTKKHHAEFNPNNKAVTTDMTWAFRMNLYCDIVNTEQLDFRLGLSYSHHSNGHTKLMNQGYNSFLFGLSADIKNPYQEIKNISTENIPNFSKRIYSYYEFRTGIGQNVFANAFNNRKNVYTIAGEYGYVFNKTFKLGIGGYYRFYQHYYDYINSRESLTQPGREFDYYASNPLYYASNVGVYLHGEILMNHIGIDLQVGYDIHKPSYKIDWRINEGWENPPREIYNGWKLGEYNTYFSLKHRISARLGLKYYWYGTDNLPKNNFYIGAHLNSNLGQADFSELSLGYVYNLGYK